MKILETDRLLLRELTPGDAPFILELLNEPGWLRFIGDRGLRTVDAARDYLVNGPMAMYDRHGFGLWAVESRDTGSPLGMAGLIRRKGLDDVDIGFAFLERHQGRGYAFEAASAVMGHARDVLGLGRVVAISSVDNADSIRLLERIGLRYEKLVTLPGNDEPVKLFGTTARWRDQAG